MGTSKRTFTQVRDILRKIDRSIDDARARRLGGPSPQQQQQQPAPPPPSPAQPGKAQRRAQPRRFNDGASVFGAEGD